LKKDLSVKFPDHLSLPTYEDAFVQQNDTKLIRELSKGKVWSLNDLKWQCSLRLGLKKTLKKGSEKSRDSQKNLVYLNSKLF
jgi:hypothetical protein